MIIVQLTGGLGNQLFQYAMGIALAFDNNERLLFDISSYKWDTLRKFELSVFKLDVGIATYEEINQIQNLSPFLLDRAYYKIINKPIPYYRFPVLKEQSFTFDHNYTEFRKKDIYLKGYWQSEKYFKNIRPFLIQKINIGKDSFTQEMKMYLNILVKAATSVSVHIRRGDYVSNPSTTAYHGLCDLEYYELAMSKIETQITKPIYFIFSDDKEYVKTVFKNRNNIVIIENIIHDYEELLLMSKCKHNIIANSSFSWWGAWLNENSTKMVIAPKKWFTAPEMQSQTKDILPDNWIKI